MKTIVRGLFLAILGILIAAGTPGCTKPSESSHFPKPSAPATPAAWPATRQTDRKGFLVTIRPEGGRIVRNEHFSLEVLLEPAKAAGAPVSVVVDADMPSHRHGMNTKPETVREADNRYRVNGMLFHMAGEWSISVEVSTGTVQERAWFPVVLE